MPTFKEQFDKLTRAYIRDEVFPMSPCACFVGNLLNRNSDWSGVRHGWNQITNCESDYKRGFNAINKESGGFYTPKEIILLESEFVVGVEDLRENYSEDQLFNAFAHTLELLKQIHISKGEQVDELVFVRRELVKK